jgi:mRNA interferase HigB
MIVVGFEVVAALVEREKRLRPRLGRTLDRCIAAWKHELEAARWTRPTDVKAVFGTADIMGDNRVVFDICGNNYRLIVKFSYVAGVARIRFAGTHQEYDRIDVTKV